MPERAGASAHRYAFCRLCRQSLTRERTEIVGGAPALCRIRCACPQPPRRDGISAASRSEPDLNGTYLTRTGCPLARTISRATCRGCMRSLYGFGRRFTARGSMRPGLCATRRCATRTSRSPSFRWQDRYTARHASQSWTVCLKLRCRGGTPACRAARSMRPRTKL